MFLKNLQKFSQPTILVQSSQKLFHVIFGPSKFEYEDAKQEVRLYLGITLRY